MDADTAVRVALLNNPDMLATYEDLGIAQSDLTQAGALQNPGFTFKRTHGDGQVFIERGITFNLLNLITAPMAVRLEQRRFEAVKLDVAQSAQKLDLETRVAYLEAVAARQAALYMDDVAQTSHAAMDLSRGMAAAGNWSKLDQARQAAFHAITLNEVARANHARVASEQKLARLLGMDAQSAALKLPDALPPVPQQDDDASLPIDAVVKQRLDVQAAQARTARLAGDLGLTKATRFIQVLDLAAVENRNEGAARAPGYQIDLSIPLFDWGTARTKKAEALYLQSASRLAATVLDARADIVGAQTKRHLAFTIAQRYRDEIIPLRRKISDETLLRYNGMLVGVFELLADAREQVTDVRGAIEAARDYWIADAALRAALSGTTDQTTNETDKAKP